MDAISFALMSDWTNVLMPQSQLISNRFLVRSNISANEQKSGFLCSNGLKFYFPARNILFCRQEYLVQMFISTIDLEY